MPLITGAPRPMPRSYHQGRAADRALFDALGPDGYADHRQARVDYYRGLIQRAKRNRMTDDRTPEDMEFEPLFET